MTNAEQLRLDRAKLINDMRQLNERAEKENRDLNTEEKSAYEKMKADAISLKDRYERIEEQNQLERELGQSQGRIVDPFEARGNRSDKTVSPEYKRAFNDYLRYGSTHQFRDMNVTTSADGGYTVPTDTATEIVMALGRGSVVRQAGARVLATSLNTTIPVSSQVTGTWEPEADPFGNNADTDPTISAFAAKAYKFTVGTKVSEELLADSAIDVESYISNLFVDAYTQASDDAYVAGAGSGSNQPTGIMSGGTAKVVAAVNTFTAAELRAHFFDLPQQYRRHPSCAWIMSDTTIAHIATMVANANNEFLWVPGLKEGEADRLMGKPVYSSSAVDSTFLANKKPLVVGAMNYYQIVDRINQAGVKRLNELYAASGQVGFIGSWRTDGAVLVPNAFRVMKFAAS